MSTIFCTKFKFVLFHRRESCFSSAFAERERHFRIIISETDNERRIADDREKDQKNNYERRDERDKFVTEVSRMTSIFDRVESKKINA